MKSATLAAGYDRITRSWCRAGMYGRTGRPPNNAVQRRGSGGGDTIVAATGTPPPGVTAKVNLAARSAQFFQSGHWSTRVRDASVRRGDTTATRRAVSPLTPLGTAVHRIVWAGMTKVLVDRGLSLRRTRWVRTSGSSRRTSPLWTRDPRRGADRPRR